MAAPMYFYKAPPCTANVYRLVGKNEDALTYALGHLMAIDDGFMLEVLKEVGVLEKVPGKQYKAYREDYKVYLQERREVGSSGRRDIVVEAGGADGLRVVIEAKIGRGQPDACQLLRYTVGCDCSKHRREPAERTRRTWGDRTEKFLVPLTRDTLDQNVRREVSSKLNGSGIQLRPAQWHQILKVALDRHRELPGDLPQSLFLGELVNFFREHYEMGYYDREVLIADVDRTNAKIYFVGRLYVGGMNRATAPLYFAPYFTKGNDGNGLAHMSRVLHVDLLDFGGDRPLAEEPGYEEWLRRVRDEASKRFGDFFLQRGEQLESHWKNYWTTGLELVLKRVEEEERSGKRKWGMTRTYFLDQPVPIRQTPLKKVRNFRQIPLGYGKRLTIADLIALPVLGSEPPS